MKLIHFIWVSTMIVACASQRSPYAGFRPIGFPEIETTTSASTQMDALGNRLGETITTQRLPIEALGDKELVNRLGKLPQDNQPFWFINWQALEANRKRPQSYPQRPSVFVDRNFFFPTVTTRVNPGNQNPGNENQNSVSQSNENQSTTNPSTVNVDNQNNENQNSVSQSNENQSTTNPSRVNVGNQNNENQNNVSQSNQIQSTTNPSTVNVGNQNNENQNNVSQSNQIQSTTNPSTVNPGNQNNENQNNVSQSIQNQPSTDLSSATVVRS